MKFLAFSDHHADPRLQAQMYDTVKAQGIDLVFIPGDFCPQFSDQIPANLVGPFLGLKSKVYVLHGNHETEASARFVEQKYHLNQFTGFVHDDVGFFGAGGADIGPFPTNDDDIFEALQEGHEKVKHAKKKVMITHVHPQGSISEKMCPVPETGSAAVRRAIDEFQPDLVICGHIHEAGGIEEHIGKTKVVNVACRGKVFDI